MEHAGIPQAEPDAAALYARMEQAIHYLESHRHEQPDLEAVARRFDLSAGHFQRVFKRMAGISPKRFLQHTTLEEAKRLLRKQASILDVAYDVGLSGAGRLHDLFVQGAAVTPGTFKNGGEGLTVRYGVHPSPFGYAFLALTPHGICELELRTDAAEAYARVEPMRRRWPQAQLVEDAQATAAVVREVFGGKTHPLHLRGTNFQLKVWQALLRIPEGALTDYSTVAMAVGAPRASRAVGSAVGDNPIHWLIPCHRVLRRDGGIGGYATGMARKQAMLAYESLLFHTTS